MEGCFITMQDSSATKIFVQELDNRKNLNSRDATPLTLRKLAQFNVKCSEDRSDRAATSANFEEALSEDGVKAERELRLLLDFNLWRLQKRLFADASSDLCRFWSSVLEI